MNDKLIPLIETKEEIDIKNQIYEFRGRQVMVDSDLASLFGVETRLINQQVKRNINRFPEDFSFQLNSYEFKILTSQNVISSYGGRRYKPFVFTEQGIIALAGVLRSEVADEMCVKISRVFVKMKTALISYAEPLKFLGKIYGEHIEFKEYTNKKFDEVFNRLEKLEPKKEVLLLNDKWFDAYEAIVKLIEYAKESIVLVDPYADHKSLLFLSNKNEGVKVTIYKNKYAKLSDEEIETFRKQYGEVVVKEYNKSHNRYLILDSKDVYDLGTSLNRLGGKIFTINKEEIEEVSGALIKLFN